MVGLFRSNGKITRTDYGKSDIIGAAARPMGIPWEHAQPGMPQTNSKVERASGNVIAGTRVQLSQAGLPG